MAVNVDIVSVGEDSGVLVALIVGGAILDLVVSECSAGVVIVK